jgi:hypothetical protein
MAAPFLTLCSLLCSCASQLTRPELIRACRVALCGLAGNLLKVTSGIRLDLLLLLFELHVAS